MNQDVTKAYSSKQEGSVADALGWNVVSGSGAAPCVPGDVMSDEWLGECKTHTSSHKIFFDLNVWKKIQDEAMMKHRRAVLFVDDGSQDLNHTWALCLRYSINLASSLTVPLNVNVRKNISFDDAKQLDYLNTAKTGNVGGFFDTIVFTYTWDSQDILIMPFNTFKELYTR